MRDTVVDMLSALGYRVLKAKDAQSALAIIESGVPIDLLFTDVVMPGPLRSPELARRARERLPDIAVLFTSGYTENAIVHGGRLDEGLELLSKPYTREALARKLRHALRNQQQRRVGRAAAPDAPSRPGNEVAKPPAPQRLRVLLVEDDETIRFTTAEMLGDLEHSVVEAGNADEALAALRVACGGYTDHRYSPARLVGHRVAAKAVHQQPALRVIFASGYDVLPSSTSRDLLARAVMLRKPYNEQTLAEALRSAMGNQPKGASPG